MKKRMTAGFLSLVMTVFMLSGSVAAASTGTAGLAENAYTADTGAPDGRMEEGATAPTDESPSEKWQEGTDARKEESSEKSLSEKWQEGADARKEGSPEELPSEDGEGVLEEAAGSGADLAENLEEPGILPETGVSCRTGYQRPVFIDLPADELPEIYEEPKEEASVRGSAAYACAWDAYSSNFYYNQLNDDQRELWDKLDDMCRGYLIGTETLTGKQHYSNPKSGLDFDYYLTKRVTYYNMSESSARNLVFMFVVSNPQYYFLQVLMGAPSLGLGGYAFLSVDGAFGNGAARQAATQKVQGVINSWMTQVRAQPTDLLKEKKIHDLICEKMTYDPHYGTTAQNQYNQTVYSVFCTDTTVCAGYSQAMALLCNAAGIDCVAVTSEEHEWNMVRLNDSWYYVDCTWDDEYADLKGMASAYPYFNRSSQKFLSDSSPSVVHHKTESFWSPYLPELLYDSGATLTDSGTIYTPSSSLPAPQILSSGEKVSISATPGATIYYTTDGGNPSAAFTKSRRYAGPFSLKSACAVKAVAVKTGYRDSAVSVLQVAPSYSVKLDAAGGYLSKKSVKSQTKTTTYNAKIGKLPSPKRKGYVFLGWYTQKSGGSKISGETRVKASKTYYARWAKVKKGLKASISSAKSGSGGTMKLKIKKNGSASGYQIRYSLKKNMSSSKKKLISETSCTIKKLKKGKTYYVQARPYQKESVSGKKTYGSWSKTKAVKMKKK